MVAGSTAAFLALVQKMHDKGVYALASIVQRRSTMLRMAALVPRCAIAAVVGAPPPPPLPLLQQY